MRHYLYLLFFVIIALFIHGYQFAYSDQEIIIPYLLKSTDSELFVGDQLFNQSSSKLSLFYSVFGHYSKYLGIQNVFFFSFIIFQYLFYLGIFRLAFIFTKRSDLSYLVLCLFFLPKFIGGNLSSTFEIFFGYRSVGIPLFIFYLYYLIKLKYLKASLFAFLAILFHPISVLPTILLLPGLIYLKSKNRKRYLLIFLSLFGIALLFFSVFIIITYKDVLIYAFDRNWAEIIRSRDSYIYPSEWKLRGWLSLGLYLTLIVFNLNKLNTKLKKLVIIITLISIFIFLVNLLFLDILNIPFFAAFQLSRSIIPLAYLGLIMTTYFLLDKILYRKILGGLIFLSLTFNQFVIIILFLLVLIFTGISRKQIRKYTYVLNTFSVILFILYFAYMITFSKNLFRMNRIKYTYKANDWVNVQIWAKDNTNKDDFFMVPPDKTGFRIFSQRPIIGDIKDGAVVAYSPTFAFKWKSTMNDLKNYDQFTEKDFINLKNRYNFSYLVTKKNHKLKFEVVFSNATYYLYKI